MKIKTLLLSVAIATWGVVAFSSCATKEHAIGQLEDLSYDLRDHAADYSATDWQKAAERFTKVRKRIERHKLTAADRKRVGKLEGQCARYMYKGAKEGLIDGIFGIGSEIQGILEGIGNLFNKDDEGTKL